MWPTPVESALQGPFALLEPRPLALWANPAGLSPGGGPSAGVGWLEPFSVPAFARADAAVAAGAGGWGLALGGTRFGAGELRASAWAAGLSGRTLAGRGAAGVSLRRHSRDPFSAWALDLGFRGAPSAALALAAVARSAVRAGERRVAPEAEWEIAVSWSRGAVAVAASLARDAVGPISRTVAARLDLGAARVQLAAGSVSGGEPRLTLAVVARFAGWIASVARETGPFLPPTRAAALSWKAGEAAPAESLAAKPPAATAEFEGDREDVELELRTEAETVAEEGEGALERWSTGPSPVAPAGPVPIPRATGREPGCCRLQTRWRVTVGSRTTAARGLGASASALLRLTQGASSEISLLAALSRDPGEPGGIDETRFTGTARRSAWGRLLVGAVDTRFGFGLVVTAPGASPGLATRSLLQVAPAGRAARARVPASRGVALLLEERLPVRVLAWIGATGRDARVAGGGSWPSGGRFHRTETERSRRGLLEERVAGLAIEWSGPGDGRGVGALWSRAHHGGAFPRLLPGGKLGRGGDWFSLALRARSRSVSLLAEAAVGPDGGTAQRIAAGTGAGGHGGAGGEIRYARRSAGFARATAWPASAWRERLEARARWSPGLAGLRLRLEEVWERGWSPPGRTVPARDRWSERRRVEIERATREGSISVRWAGRRTWSLPGPGAATARPASGRPAWSTGARWSWRPAAGSATFRLAYTRLGGAGGGREIWEAALEREALGQAGWRVSVLIRPGTRSGEDIALVEGDPLGGVRFAPSRSPSSLMARVSVPLERAGREGSPWWNGSIDGTGRPRALAIEGRWSVSSRETRFEIWCTVGSG